MTLRDLTELVKGDLVGDGSRVIRRAAKIEEAVSGDVTFVANPKYARHLETTQATAVIVSRNIETRRQDVALVRVDDPYISFLFVLGKLTPPTELLSLGIHSTAVVDPTAVLGRDVGIGAHAVIGRRTVIGDRTRIYPGVVLGDDVRIGANSLVYSNVVIREKCSVGDDVIIHPGTVIGGDGFGFAPNTNGTYDKIPQLGTVIVEDCVEIGANCTVDRATLGETRICRGVKLDNLVHVAHNCVVGENTVIAAQTGISGSTKIGKNCVVGGQVGLVGHIVIGDRITIGAQAGVTKSFVESGMKIFGYPAREMQHRLRGEALVHQLPELRAKLRALEKRLDELQSR
ncbi:MAG: UDP-3-O-(3-hydroxymyristoyl)glucosamine N-acyltransferase [Planctomycetes bacterium]|nr:UDP-3-O-(3-hydroxymyristoyl)glucosamine N-acyltransferase [Planctomycetota bacterium]MBI3847599.1 UDP-3-O-(3-hydroxymyristoyl)glucosamine N-acyltransferase [Planctomycetota bacterium]